MRIFTRFLASRTFFFLVILVIWEFAVRLSVVDPAIVASPTNIVSRAWFLLGDGTLLKHIYASFSRVIVGFTIASFMGIVIALVLFQFSFLYRYITSIIEVARSISPIALFPLFILFFGLGFSSKVAIIVWVSWIPIFINTYQGLRYIPPLYYKVGKAFGLNKLNLLLRVALPASAPYIFSGMKTAIGFSWMVIVAAEMIGSSSGLGYMTLVASSTFKTADLFVAIITISLIGVFMTKILVFIEKRVYNQY